MTGRRPSPQTALAIDPSVRATVRHASQTTDEWRHQGSTAIRLDGAVAIAEARELQARALAAVGAGHRQITVDLTAVSAIHGGLIGALLRIRRELAHVNGELILITDGPPARDVVNTAGLGLLMRVITGADKPHSRADGAAGRHRAPDR